METILNLFNDYLVLKSYNLHDEALNAYDELRDYIADNMDEANRLWDYASDFTGNFKNYYELGYGKVISPTNVRIYISEIIESIEEIEEF